MADVVLIRPSGVTVMVKPTRTSSPSKFTVPGEETWNWSPAKLAPPDVAFGFTVPPGKVEVELLP